MNDEQILKGRLLDLAQKAYHQNIYTYSNFLSLSELSTFEEFKSETSYIQHERFGGNPLCERQIIRFGSEEVFGYEGDFPIHVIKITPLIEKFSDSFTHRDFLGALMHLGIERDTLGDILLKEKTAYLFCLASISDYICKELTKVKHTNVKCEITNFDIPALKPTLVDEEFPVASLRLDAIISHLIKCSRSESFKLFEEKRVSLNGKITGRNSMLLKEGDIFSVKGYGKFIFISCKGQTKKGKIFIHIKRYV